MSVNGISSSLSITDRLEVMDLLSKIDQKLSSLIDVGPEERKSMAKMTIALEAGLRATQPSLYP